MDERTDAAKYLAETAAGVVPWSDDSVEIDDIAQALDDAGLTKAMAKLRGMAKRADINERYRTDAAAVIAALEGRKR